MTKPTTRKLTLDETFTLTNSLMVAADKFDGYADAMLDPHNGLPELSRRRLAEQFRRQAADSRKLSLEIAESDRITLSN